MVKEQLKTLILWVIAVVVLLLTAQCHIAPTLWADNQNIIATKNQHIQPTLAADEIDNFIRLWPQYKELHLAALPNKSLSIDGKQIIDWKTKIWFIYHKQDVERFFYIQQRLQDLLRQIAIKRNAEAVIKQMGKRNDELSTEMAAQYQQRLKAIQLDTEEADIVSAREEELKQLFRLYP